MSNVLRIMMLSIFVISRSLGFSQSSSLDSLAIKYMDAVNLTDTINSPLPDTIRVRIVEYFQQNKINPKDYYTTKYTRPLISNNEGFIGLVRMGALRDLYTTSLLINVMKVGSSGGEGDDIWVIFDGNFKSIKRISSTE